MKKFNLEQALNQLAGGMGSKAYQRYLEETGGIVPSNQITGKVKELGQMDSQALEYLRWKLLGNLAPHILPAAAGAEALRLDVSHLGIKNLFILGEQLNNGYGLRLEGEFPTMRLLLVFHKQGEESWQGEVTKEYPEEEDSVPRSVIEEWKRGELELTVLQYE